MMGSEGYVYAVSLPPGMGSREVNSPLAALYRRTPINVSPAVAALVARCLAPSQP